METRKSRAGSFLRSSTVFAIVFFALIFEVLPPAASPKDLGASGIFLFQGPNGPAYVQFNGLFLNGKTELRACGARTTVPKSDYKSFSKLPFGNIYSLERMQDGSMQAQFGANPPQCVLPGNFKWDKDNELSVKELIDKSFFQADVAGSDPAGRTVLPPFLPGTKIYFLSSADVELAEFLRAGWAPSIDLWHAYLAKHPSSQHASDAKKSLEVLLVADGKTDLEHYAKTAGTAPDYDLLKAAFLRAAESQQLEPSEPAETQLLNDVHAALGTITKSATDHLSAYKNAVANRKAGYPNLPEAHRLATVITGIDSQFAPGVNLLADVLAQEQEYEKVLGQAQSNIAAKQFDEAARTVKAYLAFREEEPKLKELSKEIYDYYIDAGSQAESAEKWNDAIHMYQDALGVIETADASADLARAKAGAHAAENKAAADSAVARSQSFIESKDYIRAYQTLMSLTKEQRGLVADQLAIIQPSYVQAASERAQQLQKTHLPLKGRGDEDADREAYDYLESVYELTSNDDVKTLRDLLSDKIAAYYVDKARQYIAKPSGTGIGIGWSYLSEAGVYSPNNDDIRNEQTKANATYQMRSKLSVRVEFHDQTSRRESEGFSEELQNAIATGLETSGLPVKVILPATTGAVDPNYQLVGQILEHRDKRTEDIETLKSHYVSGQHEVTNPEWAKLDTEYEQASADYDKYNTDFRIAEGKGKKSEAEELGKKVQEANQRKLDLHTRMNKIPEKLQEDTIREYSYAQHDISITDIVDISYRINDSAGNAVGDSDRIARNDVHKYQVLEGLKSEDIDSVHEKDAPPDTKQLQTDSDNQARDELVRSAHDKVQTLPAKILAKARELETAGDNEAAGELFVLYLNSTASGDTPERQEAALFLAVQFNLRHAMELSASAK